MVQLALTEWWKLLPREPRTPRLSLKTNRKFSISLCGHRYFSFWCSSIIFLWLKKKTSSWLFISFEKCSHPARVLADFNAGHPRDVSNQVCFRARCEKKINIKSILYQYNISTVIFEPNLLYMYLLLQTCHQIQLEEGYFDKCLEWISHVFRKSCPSGSRHRPHLAKVQRSRSQEQIGPRWQKVQKEPTTSWSMQWDTNSDPEVTDCLM